MSARRYISAAILLIGIIASGCRASVGNTALWARPAVAIPPRATGLNDGSEYFYSPRYEPRGDGLFIMVRIRPNQGKETTAPFLDRIKEKFSPEK